MNINNPSLGVVGPVTAPVQGSLYVENPTPYYYELSPENLNGNTDWAQWGSSVHLVLVQV
jgi:P pilus assembly chaperone PapD